MDERIRTGVVGVGHFGRYHAQKYAALECASLVAVADVDRRRAEEIAGPLDAEAVSDYRAMFGGVDAVSIAVPTRAHFEVAKAFLENGIHVLLEKPIADSVEAADALIAIARDNGALLQIGHLERFSAPYLAIGGDVTRPLYIESERIAPYQPRGTDVDVILDVMIHDIDLIQALVGSPVRSVDAVGAPVLSSREDIANTRVCFANGCVANITASRVSQKTQRRLRIFQPESYLMVDFQECRIVHMRKGAGEMFPGVPNIDQKVRHYEKGDSLQREIAAFLDAIATGGAPVVDGEAGREALNTALMIGDSLREHWRLVHEGASPAPTGSPSTRATG